MQMSKSRPILTQLDELTVDEARRLAAMLALEESGLEPGRNARGNLHCAAKGHAHKAGGNTGSLHIRPYDKEAGSESKVGDCKCFSQCGGHGRFSQYISKVGPPGVSKAFWTQERIGPIIAALQKKESFALGWLAWKKENGLDCEGNARDSSHIEHRIAGKLSGDHGYSQIRAQYVDLFVDGLQAAKQDPDIVNVVCRKRGWQPETVWQVMEEGLLSLKRSSLYAGDIQMGFAYQGLYTSDNSFPTRIIKTKLLEHKEVMSFRYSGEPTPVIADFTAPHTTIQESSRVLFEEGEPDGITWRHMFPDDGIVCLGNQHQYMAVPALLPRLRLKGKDVIYAIDRDVHKETGALLADPAKHLSVLEAIKREEPSSIKIWMCPMLPEKDAKSSKDINDFYKVCQDPDKFLMAAQDIDTHAPLAAGYGAAVQKIFRRRATKSSL